MCHVCMVQILREASDRSMAKLNVEISKLSSSIEDLRAALNTKVRGSDWGGPNFLGWDGLSDIIWIYV